MRYKFNIEKYVKRSLLILAVGASHFALADPASDALPQGGVVTQGHATIQSAGSPSAPVLNINQTSQRAVVDWHSFDVGSASTVNFNQPNAQASTLNRVTGGGSASQIFGKINAPGEVILVNPSGVYIGKNASLDVGSIAATSHHISDKDYMDGKATYDRNGATGSVTNDGSIRARFGGYVALLAPEVRNNGLIVAQQGTVVMASGEKITLNFDPSTRLASIAADPSKINSLIENKQAVEVPGGLIIMSAKVANSLIRGVINQAGSLSTSDTFQMVAKGGRIMLEGSHTTLQTGSETVARGSSSGGSVEIAGTQEVSIQSGAKVSVSATQSGHGGTITTHSLGKTTLNGTLLAQGGKSSGNGGFINTGSSLLEIGNALSVKAGNRGEGQVGAWNITASHLDINHNNDKVLSAALDRAHVNMKLVKNYCASYGGCDFSMTPGLIFDPGAIISKTSAINTQLTMDSEGSLSVSGTIKSHETAPLDLILKSSESVLIETSSKIGVRQAKIDAPKISIWGDLASYGGEGNMPWIAILAGRLLVTGSVRTNSRNNLAGKIDIHGSNEVILDASGLIAANGDEGGEVGEAVKLPHCIRVMRQALLGVLA